MPPDRQQYLMQTPPPSSRGRSRSVGSLVPKRSATSIGFLSNAYQYPTTKSRNRSYASIYDPITSSFLDGFFDGTSADVHGSLATPKALEGSKVATHFPWAWDTRQGTGLYGGGGRGANDRETGWVVEHSPPRHRTPKLPGWAEDLDHNDSTPEKPRESFRREDHPGRSEERRSSSLRSHSSASLRPVNIPHDPFNPVPLPLRPHSNNSKPPLLNKQRSSSVSLKIPRPRPPPPSRGRPCAPPKLPLPALPLPAVIRAKSPFALDRVPPPIVSRPSSRASLGRDEPAKPKPPRPFLRAITSSLVEPPPLKSLSVQRTSSLERLKLRFLPRSPFKGSDAAAKSASRGISNPILPGGFVDSLGMATVDIRRPASPGATPTRPPPAANGDSAGRPRTSSIGGLANPTRPSAPYRPPLPAGAAIRVATVVSIFRREAATAADLANARRQNRRHSPDGLDEVRKILKISLSKAATTPPLETARRQIVEENIARGRVPNQPAPPVFPAPPPRLVARPTEIRDPPAAQTTNGKDGLGWSNSFQHNFLDCYGHFSEPEDSESSSGSDYSVPDGYTQYDIGSYQTDAEHLDARPKAPVHSSSHQSLVRDFDLSSNETLAALRTVQWASTPELHEFAFKNPFEASARSERVIELGTRVDGRSWREQ